jgi:predicted transcriptional regulator
MVSALRKHHHCLTERELSFLRWMIERGASTRRVGTILGISSASVSYWARKPPHATSRRVPPLTHRTQDIQHRRKLVSQLALARFDVCDEEGNSVRRVPVYCSAAQIRGGLHRLHSISVCKQTVLNDLRSLGFVSRVRRKVPSNTAEDAKARFVFCRAMLYRPVCFFSSLLFTDEKYFCSNDLDVRTMSCRFVVVVAACCHFDVI